MAYDPFGLGPSDILHELVYLYGRVDEYLWAEIRHRSAQAEQQVWQRNQKASQDAIAYIERSLVHEFGTEIRTDPDALEQMTELDLACKATERDASLEKVAHNALRLYEVLLRRVVHAYPLPEADLDAYWNRARALRLATLERAARQVGFQRADKLYADGNPRRTWNDPTKGFVKELVTLCLLAAVNRPDHPLYRLAQEHPDLLATLKVLGELRNRGAHGSRDAGPRHDAAWCRQVGAAAVRELLRVPPPTPDRTTD
jgi:hypothetical protein